MEDLAFFGGSRVVDSTGAQPHNPWAYTDLEDALKRHLGVRYVLLVNSGTSAITAALQAAGVGPGDEVITVSHSWIAHVAAIFNCNAIPVFADVDRRTYNIDVDDVARKITPQTKAILPVDLYGLPADIPALVELAERHNISRCRGCLPGRRRRNRWSQTWFDRPSDCFQLQWQTYQRLGRWFRRPPTTTNSTSGRSWPAR